ncbi:hypothetical protein [Streptomyces sp. S.PB5]|nr:hypothetical protein [Streptomyces sp. S.PB5]MDN3027197.1 hypothetical protein [Streptomyces sp. S.PB5]
MQLVLPVLFALDRVHEFHVVAGSSGGESPAAHDHAHQRMVGVGAVPVT